MTTGGNAVLPLLETKLHAPHRRQGLVTRPRLRQRLDIARELYVSLNTFRTHTKSIYTKLGVNTRREAIRRADELGPGVLSAINALFLGVNAWLLAHGAHLTVVTDPATGHSALNTAPADLQT